MGFVGKGGGRGWFLSWWWWGVLLTEEVVGFVGSFLLWWWWQYVVFRLLVVAVGYVGHLVGLCVLCSGGGWLRQWLVVEWMVGFFLANCVSLRGR